jgi:hypothetical protein
MKNLSQNQKVNMMDFWKLMTAKIFKKFQHVQFSKKKFFVCRLFESGTKKPCRNKYLQKILKCRQKTV